MKKWNELTKAELEIMQVFWQKENVFLADVIESMPEPRPAYTTVSTIIRILVRKGFVAYNVMGKMHSYYPLITKEEYASLVVGNIKRKFFGDSMSNMISFFAKKEHLSESERAKLLELLQNEE